MNTFDHFLIYTYNFPHNVDKLGEGGGISVYLHTYKKI